MIETWVILSSTSANKNSSCIVFVTVTLTNWQTLDYALPHPGVSVYFALHIYVHFTVVFLFCFLSHNFALHSIHSDFPRTFHLIIDEFIINTKLHCESGNGHLILFCFVNNCNNWFDFHWIWRELWCAHDRWLNSWPRLLSFFVYRLQRFGSGKNKIDCIAPFFLSASHYAMRIFKLALFLSLSLSLSLSSRRSYTYTHTHAYTYCSNFEENSITLFIMHCIPCVIFSWWCTINGKEDNHLCGCFALVNPILYFHL